VKAGLSLDGPMQPEITTDLDRPFMLWLLPQLDTPVGDLDPARAVKIQQAYPRAFFDLHLRRRGHLLDGPSTAFPEVTFLP
jgi:hypothetical protein